MRWPMLCFLRMLSLGEDLFLILYSLRVVPQRLVTPRNELNTSMFFLFPRRRGKFSRRFVLSSYHVSFFPYHALFFPPPPLTSMELGSSRDSNKTLSQLSLERIRFFLVGLSFTYRCSFSSLPWLTKETVSFEHFPFLLYPVCLCPSVALS